MFGLIWSLTALKIASSSCEIILFCITLWYQRLMKLDKPQPLPDPEDITTSLHADIKRCSKMMIRPRYFVSRMILLKPTWDFVNIINKNKQQHSAVAAHLVIIRQHLLSVLNLHKLVLSFAALSEHVLPLRGRCIWTYKQ